MTTDHNPNMKPCLDLAKELGIRRNYVRSYGDYMAKIDFRAIKVAPKRLSKLILVSAMTPTPAGEGKTTTSIGLAQGLKKIEKSVALALREPSMGPLFGSKGGACGGGLSQVQPMENINLHFTGDFAAVTAAHNLLAAVLDNALHFGSIKDVDARRINFPRVLDVNDRSLRQIILGLGGPQMGIPRQGHFDITAASEIMAIMGLVQDYEDLRLRLGNIVLGYTAKLTPIFARDLEVVDALMAVLKDAIHPNLVQSTEGVPSFIHGGPFANIAHGSNSILATQMALAHADYAITEAGFAFDLGGEKFFDITSRTGGFSADLCVIVCTIRALKMHGGLAHANVHQENPAALEGGLENLKHHAKCAKKFGVEVVVAINLFPDDTRAEIDAVLSQLKNAGIAAAASRHFAQGGAGAVDLAKLVVDKLAVAKPTKQVKTLYEPDQPLTEKIAIIATELYNAANVHYLPKAMNDLNLVEKTWSHRMGSMSGPLVCMAKTPLSLSDDPSKIGCPTGHTLTIREIDVASGAGFVVPQAGDIIRMPGLAKVPNYHKIRVDSEGIITGIA